jgi:hypothetical protein
MIHSEYTRRKHLSKDVNELVTSMIAVSDISENELKFINDNLSYFKRNLQDMGFHQFNSSHDLYEISQFAYSFYDLVEKYEISKKISLSLDKFDEMLRTLHRIIKQSLQLQFILDNMEKSRVQKEAFTNMKY